MSSEGKDEIVALGTEEEKDYTLDFVTSSAISRVSVKFMILYVPIIWFSGILTAISIWGIFRFVPVWLLIPIMPVVLFAMYYVFIFAAILFTKLFLILVNLIHYPKEGVFRAEKYNNDFEFWRLRTELKKMGVWLLRNNPLPWSDAWAFRWFGIKMDFSSHMQDAWVDIDFVEFGHNVLVGQATILMSSMVVGDYLIIKKVTLEDFTVTGGFSTVAPGTVIKKDTLLGAASSSIYKQVLEAGWIYAGNPARKMAPNKLAVSKILKKHIDEDKSFEVTHEVSIDEDKKDLIKEDN